MATNETKILSIVGKKSRSNLSGTESNKNVIEERREF